MRSPLVVLIGINLSLLVSAYCFMWNLKLWIEVWVQLGLYIGAVIWYWDHGLLTVDFFTTEVAILSLSPYSLFFGISTFQFFTMLFSLLILISFIPFGRTVICWVSCPEFKMLLWVATAMVVVLWEAKPLVIVKMMTKKLRDWFWVVNMTLCVLLIFV